MTVAGSADDDDDDNDDDDDAEGLTAVCLGVCVSIHTRFVTGIVDKHAKTEKENTATQPRLCPHTRPKYSREVGHVGSHAAQKGRQHVRGSTVGAACGNAGGKTVDISRRRRKRKHVLGGARCVRRKVTRSSSTLLSTAPPPPPPPPDQPVHAEKAQAETPRVFDIIHDTGSATATAAAANSPSQDVGLAQAFASVAVWHNVFHKRCSTVRTGVGSVQFFVATHQTRGGRRPVREQ